MQQFKDKEDFKETNNKGFKDEFKEKDNKRFKGDIRDNEGSVKFLLFVSHMKIISSFFLIIQLSLEIKLFKVRQKSEIKLTSNFMIWCLYRALDSFIYKDGITYYKDGSIILGGNCIRGWIELSLNWIF